MSTLRGRLTLSYAAALVLALLAFAIVALFAVDSVQRRLLDAELRTVANAEASTVEFPTDSTGIDAPDAAHFASAAGSRVASALLAPDGHPLAASAARIPAPVARVAAQTETTMTVTLRDRGANLRAVFVPMRNGGTGGTRAATVAVWSDIDSIERIDRNLGIAFAIAIPLFAGLVTLAGSAIARRGLAPLERIIGDASEIEAHDLGARVTLPDTAELHRLATTLNRMLERLDAAFERERRFTSDASHELRAPLAIILAEADLALSTERDAAHYRRALETIAIEADALEALTRNLLATARSRDGDAPATALVDLGDVAAAAAARVRILAAARGVTIRTLLAGDAVIAGDADELEQAVLTILHNAIKYAAQEGTIGVSVEVADDSFELRVADDGPGFSRDALAHAFDRFWHENGSDGAAGHGLGLAIARSIVERYGGTIALANGTNGGAVVTIRFSRTSP